MAPLYDYCCDNCNMVEESLQPMEVKVIKCIHCGGRAYRIISSRAQNCFNDDAPWIRSVLEVVDKDSKAPHVVEFLTHPTRTNYKNWMKGEGLRHLEPGERPHRPTEKEERAEKRRRDEMIMRRVVDRRRIVMGGY